ncbi:MAG: Gfo/Idh/MocA family oxidoreductase [Acidobacteriota bacterium]|nr:Gfo/Idh/MocA family oxidoreductase [Acidobacteriota bacterium]
MTLRVGLIGAGGNTKLRHIPGFQAIEGVDITSVCNRSIESGQKVADEFGIPGVVCDWREVVDDEAVDAICIGTWPYMHCPMTLAGLAAGKHVLTEARMAMSLAEAGQMHAAAQASDRVAMIVPAPFYLAYERTLLDMLAEGVFGDLLEIHVCGLGGGHDPGGARTWRQRRDLSGSNIMAMGILNETVRRYAGHERSLVASGKIHVEDRVDPDTGEAVQADIPDSLGIVAEHRNGAVAVYHLSNVARGGRNGSFEVFGTKGAFRLEGGKAWVATGGDFEELKVVPEKMGGWRVEEDFVDAIRDGRPVTHTSFADGVRYMQFTEAVQIALVEGRRVELGEL